MSEMVYFSVRIPRRMREAIIEAVERGYYLSSADLVRNAIRKELQRLLIENKSGGGEE